MNPAKRLSIYIPTYNRASRLKELFAALQAQLIALENRLEIEVVVSDNASPDDTEKIIEQAKLNGVVDIAWKNDANLGGEWNFMAAEHLTTGAYIWFLCDDDLPQIGAIKTVLELIDQHPDVGMFYLNRTKETMELSITSANGLPCLKKTGEMTPIEVLLTVGKELITSSCLMVRRSAFQGALCKKYGHSGRLISPVALAIDGLKISDSGYVSPTPLVRYRHGDNSSWSALWPWIWTVCIPIVLEDGEKYLLNTTRNSTEWSQLDEIKTTAVLIMLLRRESRPRIASDWKWITRHLLTDLKFLRFSLLILYKRMKSIFIPT